VTFLRYSLYTDTQQLVTVEQEIYAVNRYLQIEQARFGERLVVDINGVRRGLASN
jgi:two-component system LytT family sensor kinase